MPSSTCRASEASEASSTSTPDSLAISMLTFFPSFPLAEFLVPRPAGSSGLAGEGLVSGCGGVSPRPAAGSWPPSAACRASYRS